MFNTDRIYRKLPMAVAVLLTAYVALRAIYVPLYSDEVFTFFTYVQTGGFQPFHAHLDANNHVLNSTFAHLSHLLLGDTPIVLRLPNVLALVLMFIYLFRFRSLFDHDRTWLMWFMSMALGHYLLEFFQLCRGYGLSFAFLIGAVYHLEAYRKTGKVWHPIFGFALLSMAVWSNLSVLVSTLAVGGLLALACAMRDDSLKWRFKVPNPVHIAAFIILFIVPHIYAALYSFELKANGRLYLGSDSGFWDSVVMNLSYLTFVEWGYSSTIPIVVVSILALLLTFDMIRSFAARPVRVAGPHLILLFSVVGTIALHHLFGVNYPTERAAAHFIPLFLLSLYVGIDRADNALANMVGVILPAAFALQFFSMANISHTISWKNEAVPPSFYRHIVDWKAEEGRNPYLITDAFHSAILAYYDHLYQGGISVSSESIDSSSTADLVMTSVILPLPVMSLFDTLDHHEASGVTLLKRKRSCRWMPVAHFQRPDTAGRMEYVAFIVTGLEQLQCRSCAIAIDASFTAQSPTYPFGWWYVTQVFDGQNNLIMTVQNDLQRGHSDIGLMKKVEVSQLLGILPPEASYLKSFVWNMRAEEFSMANMQATLNRSECN
ncbi:MAG: hypothetical protein K9J06_03910 [Flavobacteriales bacterium]|nr:hypothetical protein [Flavobacteriales bacterium]